MDAFFSLLPSITPSPGWSVAQVSLHTPLPCAGGAAWYHPPAALCTCALLPFPQPDLLPLSFPFTAAPHRA